MSNLGCFQNYYVQVSSQISSLWILNTNIVLLFRRSLRFLHMYIIVNLYIVLLYLEIKIKRVLFLYLTVFYN
jgi:hypothetical protein